MIKTYPKMTVPSLPDIEKAAERIRPYIHRTPVHTCTYINHLAGAQLFFKCENFQKTGSFKMRGAANAVMSLPNELAARGVATHSSGNHAQAVARAAQLRGIPAYIVMPENAPEIKKKGVEGYGGRIILCKPTLQAREDSLNAIVAETGAEFIPPYNDYRTIAGQASCARELLAEVPDLDYLLAPCGGGGLLSGTALAAHYLSPATKVVGCEPLNASDAYQSFVQRKLIPVQNPDTIADGLRTSLGDKTFDIITRLVANMLTATEEQIVAAMRLVWEKMKIVIEPSCAVPLAALLAADQTAYANKKIGIILTGGNVDLDRLPWIKG